MEVFEKFIERVAGSLLAIIAMIYISGFIIVNAYLSRFHVAQIELFQPAFISAGLFFSLVAGFTAILIYPIARAITVGLSFFDSQVEPQQSSDTGTRSDFLRNVGLMVVALIPAVLLILIGYFLERTVGNSLVLNIIAWASGQNIDRDLSILLGHIAGLQGLAVMPAFLLIQNREKLGKLARDGAITLSVMAFLSIHAYSLLLIAKEGYEVLPNNIGGGQPGYVRFYVTQENAKRLAILDDAFQDKGAIIPENCDMSDELIVTNRLTLFWQIKSVSLRGDEEEEIYFVRPSTLTCDRCPIIKIYGSSVYAVVYDNPPDQ